MTGKSATALLGMTLLTIAHCAADVSVKEYMFRGGNTEDRAAYFAQKIHFWGSEVYPKEPTFLGRLIILTNDRISYAFWLQGHIDQSGNWIMAPGIVRPSRANWSTDFYHITIGDQATSKSPAVVKEVKPGSFTIQWQLPDTEARLTLTLPAESDCVLLKTQVAAAAGKAGDYTLQLTCYPSSFGVDWKTGRAVRLREALTPKRSLILEDKTGSARFDLAQDEPWALFYDQHFCLEKSQGDGPCAMLYDPHEAIRAQTMVGNYACAASLSYPLDRPSHLILWDFTGMTNQAATDYMRRLKYSFDP